jgi:5-methylcytosine-specific restriction endonuclease McrA
MALYGPVWEQVMERYDWTCQYCGEPATELDHILPVKWGGGDEFANQVASCHTCNQLASGDRFCGFHDKWWFIKWMRDRGYTGRGRSQVDRCQRH